MTPFTARDWLWWSIKDFIDAHNDIIFEKDKADQVSFKEQKQRGIFIRRFNATKLKNVQQMYNSRALKSSKIKITGDWTISSWKAPHRTVSTSLGFDPEHIQWVKSKTGTARTQKFTVYPPTSYIWIGRDWDGFCNPLDPTNHQSPIQLPNVRFNT